MAAAMRHGVDPALVSAVVAVESGGLAGAVSRKGARGLMQLMPATAQGYGERDPRRLHLAAVSIDLGTRHLRALMDRYGGNAALALAAYNAGDSAVARHGLRIPPYRETQLYVAAVLARMAASTAAVDASDAATNAAAEAAMSFQECPDDPSPPPPH